MFAENPREGKQRVLFENKRPDNLETLEWIHNKLGTMSNNLFPMNLKKIPSFSSNLWGSSYPKSSIWIAQICNRQISARIKKLIK